MKRRILIILAAVFLLTGCGNEDYAKYVTLGDYTNLGVEMTQVTVTKQEVEERIADSLVSFADYKDRDISETVENDDYVVANFMVYLDQELVYDYSEETYEIAIGAAEFGDEVDAWLIGKKVGDSDTLEVTFDNRYDAAELAGKQMEFQLLELVSINYAVLPTLTDEFAKESLGVQTQAEYYNQVETQLLEEKELEANDDYEMQLLDAAVDATTYHGYPKKLYEKMEKQLQEEYASMAEMFGISVEELYVSLGLDDSDAFEQEILDYTYEELLVRELAKEQGIIAEGDAYQQFLETMVIEEEWESMDELLDNYETEELQSYYMQEAVVDYLAELNQ